MSYLPLLIGTILLFLFIAVMWFLAFVTNLGDSRSFNPDWINEVRHPRTRRPIQRHRTSVIVGAVQTHADGYKRLVRKVFENMAPSRIPYHLAIHHSLAYLDSANIVAAISANLRRPIPRDLHPYLDFSGGTVVWRLEVRG